MPARNAEGTILLAISSTLKALGPEDEVLLGVHESLDATLSLSKRINDKRLRIYEFENCSFSEMLNQLVELAHGDLIARMDSDDICLPWRFRMQWRFLKKNSVDFVFSTAIISIPSLKKIRLLVPQYPFRFKFAEISRLLVDTNPLNHPTFFGKKSVFRALGGYRNVAGEDLDLWLRAILQEIEIAQIAIPCIVYRLSASQLSRQSDYIEGWKNSPEISAMRQTLRTRNAHLPRSSFLTSLCINMQLIGFPTPRKVIDHFVQGRRTI